MLCMLSDKFCLVRTVQCCLSSIAKLILSHFDEMVESLLVLASEFVIFRAQSPRSSDVTGPSTRGDSTISSK